MKDLSNKNVLVTGGAGFVGSNMCEMLMNEGANVTVFDNMSSGKEEFMKRFSGKKEFSVVRGDLLDKKSLSGAISGKRFDAVVHLAANPDVSLGTKQTDLDLRMGTIATYNVLDEARLHDIPDFLFSSSSVVYGVPTVRPTPEDYGPELPISLYGASKLASEGLITSFSHLYGINYYVYRFANVIGNNLTHGVVLDFLRKLEKTPNELEVLGNGKQRKSYIDVQDCVNAMLYIYKNSESKENLYNLATDGQTSVEYIANMIIERFAPSAKIRYTGGEQGWPGDIANTYLSNKKLMSTGFRLKHQKSDEAVDAYINSITGKKKVS